LGSGSTTALVIWIKSTIDSPSLCGMHYCNNFKILPLYAGKLRTISIVLCGDPGCIVATWCWQKDWSLFTMECLWYYISAAYMSCSLPRVWFIERISRPIYVKWSLPLVIDGRLKPVCKGLKVILLQVP
jgi:hypothetical protein